LSPGFQPWEALSKRIALKGREVMVRLTVALRLQSGAPSGLFAGEIRLPGVKPWAESYSPFFGARVAGTTLNTSQRPDAHQAGRTGPGPFEPQELHNN